MSPNSESAAAAGRLEPLDVLRGLAVVSVVLSHFTSQYRQRLNLSNWTIPINYSSVGVEAFFMISGLVITASLARNTDGRNFAESRFARLFPAYWVAVLFAALLGAVFTDAPSLQHASLGEVAVNMTMLAGFFRVAEFPEVGWTLGVELAFYALAWLAASRGLLKGRYLYYTAIGWMLTTSALHLVAYSTNNELLIYASDTLLVARFAPMFALGMSWFTVWSARRRATPLPRVDLAWLVATMTCAMVLLRAYGTSRSMAGLIAINLFFLATLFGRLDFLATRPLVFLGTISYATYLVHQPLGIVMLHFGRSAGLPPTLTVAIAVVVVFLAGTALCFGVERPMWRRLSARRRRTIPAPPTAVASRRLPR